jgi:hypothetical protein
MTYEEYLTRGNPRVTARLPEGPVRVTSWLAGWLDYVFAIALVAGRWLRLPIARPTEEPVMLSAFAPALAEQYGPRWDGSEPRQKSGALVRAAEIAMLSVSFFLAAHLLSGGTPTVTAPDLGAFGRLSERARAETLPVPSASSKLIEVPAGSFTEQSTANTAPAAETEPAPATTEEIAVLAEPSAADGAAAGVAEATPVAEPAPAATVAEEPPAPPAQAPPPAPVPAPAVAPPAPAVPSLPDRYLTVDELRSAALAAGWPAALLPQIETVAWCESRYHTHAQYLGALGLMQMLPFWFEVAGLDRAMWADPVTNLKAAYVAYVEHERITGDPWSAWTCKP